MEYKSWIWRGCGGVQLNWSRSIKAALNFCFPHGLCAGQVTLPIHAFGRVSKCPSRVCKVEYTQSHNSPVELEQLRESAVLVWAILPQPSDVWDQPLQLLLLFNGWQSRLACRPRALLYFGVFRSHPSSWLRMVENKSPSCVVATLANDQDRQTK